MENNNIPRYDKSGFKPIRTPKSKGQIKSYLGGKLCKDGVLRYPQGVEVDLERAAKAQALFDYSGSTPLASGHRAEMIAIYGETYLNELKRLREKK